MNIEELRKHARAQLLNAEDIGDSPYLTCDELRGLLDELNAQAKRIDALEETIVACDQYDEAVRYHDKSESCSCCCEFIECDELSTLKVRRDTLLSEAAVLVRGDEE